MSDRRLLVLHVDGVGYDVLRNAIGEGLMPHVGQLLDNGYSVQPYRCGLPSTTPCVQAAILYGDNRDIAGFRWFDKRSGVTVEFGVKSSFKRVAHRYFQHADGLASGGAAIAACYPGGARRTFGISFKQREYRRSQDAARHVLARFFSDPRHIADVGWQLGFSTGATTIQYLEDRLRRRHPAVAYMAADILEEIFVHHLTREAVKQAMEDGEPVIYAGFYAYDEAAHGFGPQDPFCRRMLRNLDKTLGLIAQKRDELAARGTDYELVMLSDHGQTPSRPFTTLDGRRLGEVVSELVPRMEVHELKGKTVGPHGDELDGHVVIAPSGGLCHIYLSDLPGRLSVEEIDRAAPGLMDRLARHDGIHFALVRTKDGGGVLVTHEGRRTVEDSTDVLQEFDDPQILKKQLHKLNSFETAGDIMLVGRWDGHVQVNFENQLGGHGTMGGEQGHPFVISRAELQLPVTRVVEATELHPILRRLREGATR